MALSHLQTPPVPQGGDINGCWAACLSWWLQAVRGYRYSMLDIITFYNKWVNQDEENPEKDGALTGIGLDRILMDQRWHLDYEPKITRLEQVTPDLIEKYLVRSPILFTYYEPNVEGFHMNVIVSAVNLFDITSGMIVMDPAYPVFQIRTLGYYRKYFSKVVLAYSMRPASTPMIPYAD